MTPHTDAAPRADAIFASIAAFVGRLVEPIAKRIDGVGQRIEGLERRGAEQPVKGNKGDAGDKGDKGEKGDPGESGADAYQLAQKAGFKGTFEDWMLTLKGEPGRDGDPGAPGDDVDMEAVKQMIDAAVAQLPRAADGKAVDVDAVALTKTVLERCQEWVAALPKPADGRDADMDAVRAFVGDAVRDAARALPAPRSAYDIAVAKGFAGSEDDWLRSLAGPRGEKGEAGDRGADAVCKSVYDIAVEAGFAGSASDWLQALKGERGEKGDKGDAGRDGLEGVPGRDALDLEIVERVDPSRRYQRYTFAHYRGGFIKAFRTTDPLGADDDLETRGWRVAVNGIAGVETFCEDKQVGYRLLMTDGKAVALAVPGMVHRGIWNAAGPDPEGSGRDYRPNETCRWDGSLWLCLTATCKQPGDDVPEWTLAARRGRDGKDGKKGDRGDRGAEGRAGRDLTQLGPDGSRTY
jgi:hypothetical protein